MNRRIRNVILFVGSFFGGILLVAGIVEIGRGDRAGWLYVLGALLAFALAFTPGRRLRDAALPPDA